VVKGEQVPILGSLEIAGRHLAGLRVALEIEAKLLAFDDFAHACTLDSRDVNERIRAAIVRLDEAEALGGIKPFNCASGHDEPFHSNITEPQSKALRMRLRLILKGKFVRRGANRAVTKVSKQKIDKP